MIIAKKNDEKATIVTAEGFKGASMHALVGPAEGWQGHVMRLVCLEEGGHTSRHAHPWPHINYVAKGQGTLFLQGEEHPFTEGTYAYIPAGEEHQFTNTGEGRLEFVCIVPEEGHK